MEFIGAFESTYIPHADTDVLETSGHVARWQDDLALLRDTGITRLRYPIRWHRIEAEPGAYDWSETDRVLGHLRDEGFEPIVDLVHHTSYPAWLERGFADSRFPDAYLRYCEAFARRYPWVSQYTVFNEPFATLFLCGHEAIWPPYGKGMESLVGVFENVLPSIFEATRMYRDLLPDAEHIYVDTCEGHTAFDEGGAYMAEMANDRRFFALDLLLGRDMPESRPFVTEVLVAGGEKLFDLEPGHIDVLGLDYYAHSEWCFSSSGGITPSPQPLGLAALAATYHERYDIPLILSETNIRGYAPDRVSWLKHTLEQVETARAAGIPLNAFCWFPFIDSVDWDSLLARADRHVDPVGVYWLDENLDRRASTMSEVFASVVGGASSSELPAFRFQPPIDTWLRGFSSFMDDWEWQDPPAEEVGMCANTREIHNSWEVVSDFIG
ncbi:MAG: family 1 glycosylhydrolase [Actinomycetota bacterium]|nr:family 1 glycosylhydrolase [Actinomycetota bacterium]